MALGACGDDSSTPIDAPVVTPDAPMVDEVKQSDSEGGGFIYEYVNISDDIANMNGFPAGLRAFTRSMVHFMNHMTPETTPGPMLNMCQDLYVTNGYPYGQGTNRQYIDVGWVNVVDQNGVAFQIPKATAANTMTFPKNDIGLQHDIFYQYKHPPAYQTPGAYYDVALGGSSTFNPVTFPKVLYMPEDFTASMSPGLNAAVALTAGTDFTTTWTPPANADAPHEGELINLTFLVDPNTGSPVIMCVDLTTAGTATIPGAMIQSYKTSLAARGEDSSHAILSRQQASHLLRRLPNGDPANKRRIDFLSVWCNVQIVAVNAAP